MNKTRRRARREDVNKEKRSPLSLRTGRREVERHRVVVGSTTHPRNRANQKNEKKEEQRPHREGTGKLTARRRSPMTRRRRAGKGDLYHIIGQTKPVTFLPPRTRGETGRFGARRKTRPKKRDRERERERVHTRYASGSRRQDRVAYSPGPSYNLGLTLCS